MSALHKDKIALRLQQLPPLPRAVSELLASFAKEDVDVDHLARQISHDQAISARVLRVANSSFYGLQNKVATIQEAVVVLGFRAVRSMVLAVGMNSAFQTDQCRGFELEVYQRHCVGTSLVARGLADMAGCNRDLAFTAGLLHDIGRLALASNFPAEYAAALDYQRKHDCFAVVAERDVLGIDHAQVGGILAETWHFPESLHQAVSEHHEPAAASADSLANLIHVADITAHALDFSHLLEESAMPLDPVAWERIGGDWRAFRSLLPPIEKNFAETCQSLLL